MYELSIAMSNLQVAGQAMECYANDAITQEKYRAALQIYTKKLQIQWDIAHEFMKEHQDVNEKIFKDAITYLDIAIDNANYELAESALALINVIKEKEPDFYQKYYKILFGKK